MAPVVLLGVAFAAQAQTAPAPAPVPPVPGAASAPARPASAPASQLERVNVTGSRDENEQRRQSTAAKIVVGREEIEKYGDGTVGELLRRLPGVTVPGAPGRGGAPRMRGLGSGYTQILLDGQRVPPGFSIESLEPEQVERIEIYRAPTAETGARAIAGNINIITREGYRRRVNDVRAGFAVENGQPQVGATWTRNGAQGAWTLNHTLSVFGWDK